MDAVVVVVNVDNPPAALKSCLVSLESGVSLPSSRFHPAAGVKIVSLRCTENVPRCTCCSAQGIGGDSR